MGKRLFILLAFLALVTPLMVSAGNITVSLATPTDAYSSSSSTVTFGCNAASPDAGGNDISSISLYIGPSGALVLNKTVSGASLSESVSGIPNGDWKWNCKATNNISEETPAAADYSLTVAVVSNYAPNFTGPIPNQTFAEDSSATVTLSTYFSDVQSLTYTATGSTHISASISGAVATISASANWSGTEGITFTANDGSLTNTSNTVYVNVTPVNDAPMKRAIPEINWTKGTNNTFDISSYFSDVEGDTLVYSISANVTNIIITISGSTVRLSPSPSNWTGTRDVIFTANDGKATTSSNTVTLRVYDTTNATNTTNKPPVLTCSPGGTGTVYLTTKESKGLSVTKSDPNSGDVLTVAWLIDNTAVSGETGDSYTFSKATEGTYAVKADVYDGKETSTCAWKMVVSTESSTNVTIDESSINYKSIIDQQTMEKPRCGDGVIQEEENCENCQDDVKCAENEECAEKMCVTKKPSNRKAILILAIIATVIGGGSFAAYLFTTKRRKIERPLKEASSLSKVQKEVPSVDLQDLYSRKEHYKGIGKRQEIAAPSKEAMKETPLQKYVREMRENGFDKDEIAEKLKAHGWTKEEIKGAL